MVVAVYLCSMSIMSHTKTLWSVTPASACITSHLQSSIAGGTHSTNFHLQAAPVKVTQVFPDGKTVYGFTFDKSKFKWVPWGELLDPTPIPADAEYTNIIVPTVDTVRYTFLLDQLVRSNKHCLLVGPTGTGKTAYIKKHLQGGLPDSFASLFFNFSAQTSANMTQV